MIRLMIKIFIKNPENVTSPQVRQAYGILSGAAGIVFNVLLFAGKFFAGMLSNSIAITADAFNNLSDAGSSVITLIGFKMAGQKPDPDHPFGHGRIEYLSGLFVSIAILFMAFELLKTSAVKIFHPEEVSFSPVIIGILLCSIVIKCYMYFYNRHISRKINSAAMMATAKDSLSDTLSTCAVLAAALVSHFTSLQIDGYCGILVGLFILYTGFDAAKDTINPLLGQAPDPEFVNQVEALILSYPDIIGIHDLIVHNYGPGRVMISVHAEVPSDGDILMLHDTIDNIEQALRSTLLCEAVIHMDPVCLHDEETIQMKETVTGFVREIDASLSLHDFRLVKGPTHTNIIFDVLIPYNFRLSDRDITALLEEKITSMNGRYYAVINIDKKFA